MSLSIAEIMFKQYNLQKSMGNPGTGHEYAEDGYSDQGVKEMLLAAMVECSEALGEISWKPWKKPGYCTTDNEALATELMDIVQFVANAAIYAGLTGDDLEAALRAKWKVNDKRVTDGETTSA